jgi:hypothetical protein
MTSTSTTECDILNFKEELHKNMSSLVEKGYLELKSEYYKMQNISDYLQPSIYRLEGNTIFFRHHGFNRYHNPLPREDKRTSFCVIL